MTYLTATATDYRDTEIGQQNARLTGELVGGRTRLGATQHADLWLTN